MAAHDTSVSELSQLRRRVEQLEARLEQSAGAEQELERFRERWQRVVENSPDVIVTIDHRGVIEYISRPKRPEAEVVGSISFDYLVEKQREAMQAAVARVFETGETVSAEIQEHEWGCWYAVRLAPLRIGERIESVVAICTDITERRQMELSLRESEARLRQMAENIRDVFYLSDPEQRRVLYISPAYDQIWGRSRDEVYADAMAFTASIHPDDRKEALPAIQARFEGGGEECIQYRIVREDGTVRWIEDRCYDNRDDAGNASGVPHRLAGICSDITQRKNAEEELRSSRDELERAVAERTRELRLANRKLREELAERKRIAAQLTESEGRFRILVETSPIPVVISEPEGGELVYVNPRMGELVGVPVEQLTGRRTPEFYEDPSDRRTLLETLRRDGQVSDREVRLKRADGRVIWVSVSMRYIDYNGRQRLYAGLVDIDKTKQAQESLRAERRLLKRLLELHERDRQLIAYEIHDGMVQDMTGAAMFAEAARHAIADNEEIRGRLDQSLRLLRASIDEARRMITGLRPPILEDQGLVAAIENFVAEVSATNGMTVDLRHDVQFGRIAPALEMALYRTVQEGLNNVWQHSGSKVARVVLAQQGERVRVSVQDWGSGFDQAKTKTRRYGLVGIKERARLLGGEARIVSELGEGTRIDVELPLADVLLPDEPHDIDS